MYFCIRDDDTSFFTSPDELEHAYGEITNWGPVSLAVIPFCRAGFSKGVPESQRGRWTTHPLHENGGLVNYLRESVTKGRFEIMLHGYYHDEPLGSGEFLNGTDLAWKVRNGRKYLQDLLGCEIRVFVAPKNMIGREGLRAISRAGLHFGGSAGIRSGWSLASPKTWMNWTKLKQWRRSGAEGVPWIFDLGDHREMPGNAVTPSAILRNNKAAFQVAVKVNGTFCAATHYWELGAQSKIPGDPPVGMHLRELIEMARSDSRVLWASVGDVICKGALIN